MAPMLLKEIFLPEVQELLIAGFMQTAIITQPDQIEKNKQNLRANRLNGIALFNLC